MAVRRSNSPRQSRSWCAATHSRKWIIIGRNSLPGVGGSAGQCGWLKDKYGLSWQIVPARLPDLIKRPKAMQAMLQMQKLDIAELERAAQS